MNLITLIVASLATWEIIEIWHHSAIMAPWRARTELWEGFAGDLLRCPFCMSPWVALASLIGVTSPAWLGWPGYLPALVVFAFAIARLANLCNDVGHGLCRTPRHNRDLPPSSEGEES